MNKKILNLHRPIGVSETHKGASLSVADLIRKTSTQYMDELRLNSRLKDMFESGLTEVQEDKLLEFAPLQLSAIRDMTDLDVAREEARAYVRSQFESWQKSKIEAAKMRRAALQREAAVYAAARQQKMQQSQNSVETNPPTNVVPSKSRFVVK